MTTIGEKIEEAELGFSRYVEYTLELEGKVKELEEENRKIKKEEIRAKESWRDLYREQLEKNKKLEEKIRFLEECLDRKEKVNQSLREELDKFSEAYKRYRDYEKEELAESCYDFARENDRLKERVKELETDYDRLKVAFGDVVSGK